MNFNRTTTMVALSRILQFGSCLVLGSVSIARAQMQYDLPQVNQPAPVIVATNAASASPEVTTGGLTNPPMAIRLVPVPKGDLAPGLSYSRPPSQQTMELELNQQSLSSRIRLADLVETTYPQGWRFGDGGILSYRTRDRRSRFVLRYEPDLRVLPEDFARLNSFNLVWRFSLGRIRKPRLACREKRREPRQSW